MSLLKTAAQSLGGLILLFQVTVAMAASTDGSIQLFIEQVGIEEDGRFSYWLGYEHDGSAALSIPVGSNNGFSITPEEGVLQPPSLFETGRHVLDRGVIAADQDQTWIVHYQQADGTTQTVSIIASAPSRRISPVLENGGKVLRDPENPEYGRIAEWGYYNRDPYAIYYPAETKRNRHVTGAELQWENRPEVFLPGRHYAIARSTWDLLEDTRIVWQLDGRTATADANRIKEPEPRTDGHVSLFVVQVGIEIDGRFSYRFGYEHDGSESLTIPVGTDNGFAITPQDGLLQPPTTFDSGRHVLAAGIIAVDQVQTWTVRYDHVDAEGTLTEHEVSVSASAPAGLLSPVLENGGKVLRDPNDPSNGRIAEWGYLNRADYTIYLPAQSAQNRHITSAELSWENRLEYFLPGRHYAVARSTWDLREDTRIVWHLDGHTATADAKHLVDPPDNTAPEALADQYTTAEGALLQKPAATGLLANDTDADGDPLTIQLLTQPSHGQLQVEVDGSFSYQHDGSETSFDSFTYQITDPDGASDQADVTITISAVNEPPIANNQTASTDEDIPVTVTLSATDVDDTVLVYTASLEHPHGTVVVSGDQLTFQPASNWFGDTSITFTVTDPAGASDTGTVSLQVKPVNDPPVADNQEKSTNEDTPITIILSASDIDDTTFTYTAIPDQAHGAVAVTGDQLTFTPDADWNGTASVIFTVTDSAGASDTGTLTIDVLPQNDQPITLADQYTVSAGKVLPVAASQGLLANDQDPEGLDLQCRLVASPAHGTLLLNADGSFTYQHDASDSTSDQFTYQVYDGAWWPDEQIVSVTITPVDEPLPILLFSKARQQVEEQAGQVSIGLSLDKVTTSPVTVDLLLTGSVSPGVDVEAIASSLTIPVGVDSHQLIITVIDDTIDEADENLLISLSNIQGAGLGDLSSHELTIIDNDFGIAQIHLADLHAVYDGQPHGVLVSTTPPGLAVRLWYDDDRAEPVVVGSYAVRAQVMDPDYIGAASATLIIVKARPQLSWSPPDAIVYGTALSDAQLLASADVAGSIAYQPATGAVLPAGEHRLQALLTPQDSHNYESAVTTVPLQVNKAQPELSWKDPWPIRYGTALSTRQLNATADIDGGFAYAPQAGAVLPAGTHELSVLFQSTDAANYHPTRATVQQLVQKATPPITWPQPAAITLGTALSPVQLNATSIVAGSFVYTPEVGNVLALGSHELRAVLTPDDQQNYSTATVMVTIEVPEQARQVPLLAWEAPAAIVYGTALSAVQLRAQADIPGQFDYAPAAGEVLPVGQHILSATFQPDDSETWQTASITTRLQVVPAYPVITWDAPADVLFGTALSGEQLNATASVPGEFTYTPALGLVLPVGSHVLQVDLTPADPVNYTAATASVTLTVTPSSDPGPDDPDERHQPFLAWPQPTDIVYGTVLSNLQLNATASVPGTFTYTPAADALLPAGPHVLSANFQPEDTENYQPGTITASLQVLPAASQISWLSPAAIVYGTALSDVQLNAGANIAGILRYTPEMGTLLPAGDHILQVELLPTDARNYARATASVDLQVNKRQPVLTWPQPEAMVYGTRLSVQQLQAQSSLPGSFDYDPAVGSLLPAGVHELTAHFRPANPAHDEAGTILVELTVQPAKPQLIWPQPAAIAVGTPLSSVQLRAQASVPGRIVYTPGNGTELPTGTHTLRADFTPSDDQNYTTTSETVDLTVQDQVLGVPQLNWPQPETIVYGTALSSTQLNVSATDPDSGAVLAGFMVYTPGTGTVLATGTKVLSATFHPSDTDTWQSGSITTTLQVQPANPVITWADPAAIVYGTALSDIQLNASVAVSGSLQYLPATGAVLDAGAQPLQVSLLPDDSVNYTAATATVSLLVRKHQPQLTWLAPPAIVYGTRLSSEQLNATASVSGRFTYTPDMQTMLSAGEQVLSAQFQPDDARNQHGGTVTTSITVLPATPSISWTEPAAITYGTVLSDVQLNAMASIPGRMQYTPAAGTVLTAGAHQLQVTCLPADAQNYQPVSASVTLTVHPALPAITWDQPKPVVYGTALSEQQLAATANISGAFTYSPGVGAVLSAGNHRLSAHFQPDDSVNYLTNTATTPFTVQQAEPTIVWPTPSAITVGTMLSATQLNASSLVAGSFRYSPGPGVPLPVGQHILRVELLPSDQVNYTSATAAVTQMVEAEAREVPSLRWPAPSPIVYGTLLSSEQLSATAWQPGGTQSLPGMFSYSPAAGTALPAGEHILTATFQPDNAQTWRQASITTTIIVQPARPVLTWEQPQAIPYGTVLSAQQLDASADTAGSFRYTPAAGTLLPENQHVLSVAFQPVDTRNYTSATAEVALSVVRADPVLSWETPAPIVYGRALGSSQLNASCTIPGSMQYEPGIGAVLPAGEHSLHVTFTPVDQEHYASMTAQVRLLVQPATPVLTWKTPDAITYGTGLSAIQLNARADIAGSMQYDPAIGTQLNAGEHRLTAHFTADDSDNYIATDIQVLLRVKKAAPSIDWQTPSAIRIETPLSDVQLHAQPSVPGNLVYQPPAGTVLPEGSHRLSVTLTPDDDSNYTQADATVSLQVQASTILLNWPDPEIIVYGTALSGAQLNAQASVAGSYVYSPGHDEILAAGSQTLSVRFTPDPAVSDEPPLTASVVLEVRRAIPELQWQQPDPITYGTGLGAQQLRATAALPGRFEYLPEAGSFLPVGSYRLSALFFPTDYQNYSPADILTTLEVQPATPLLSWPAPAAIPYGTALSSLQLQARANTAGAFSYEPGLGTVLPVGQHSLRVVFTPDDTLNYRSGTGSELVRQIQVLPARPVIIWEDPDAITYGTVLDQTQLNASASVPGTFNYAPVAGTQLPAGQHQLTTVFTPSDTTNYATNIQARVSLLVDPARPLLSWPEPSPIIGGAALTSSQLNASSSVPGTFMYEPPLGFIPPVGEHILSAHFTPDDQANYLPGSIQVPLLVQPGTVTLRWQTPEPIVYGTALDDAQLNASCDPPEDALGDLVYQPSAGEVLPAGLQTLTVTWQSHQTGGDDPVSAQVRLLVRKATPEVWWQSPEPASYGTPISEAQRTAGSAVSGSFAYAQELGTVLGGGQHLLQAHFSPAAEYADNYVGNVPVSTTWRILPAMPQLSWLQPTPIAYGTPLSCVQLQASADVPGSLVYHPSAGTVLAVGQQQLQAFFTPTNTANYSSADIDTTLLVQPSAPTITWPQPVPYRYPQALPSRYLNARASLPGELLYAPTAGIQLLPGEQVLSVDFVPDDLANVLPAEASVNLTVLKGLPDITWEDPEPVLLGTQLDSAQLNADSEVSGAWVYQPALGETLTIGEHELHVRLLPQEADKWEEATATVPLLVLPEQPEILWQDPEPIIYGTGLSSRQLNASCAMPGTFTYNPEAGGLLEAGEQILRCTFTPAPDYPVDPVTASVILVVKQAQPEIEWSPIAPIFYPTALSSVQLNAVAWHTVLGQRTEVAGSYEYTPEMRVVLPIETQHLAVHFEPENKQNYLSIDAANQIVVLESALDAGGGGGNDDDDDDDDDDDGGGGGSGSGGGNDDDGGGGGGGGGNDDDDGDDEGDKPDPRFGDPIQADPKHGFTRYELVFKKRPPIAWEMPAPINYGTELGSDTLNAFSPVPGQFLYDPDMGTVLEPGEHLITATFVPFDASSYISSTSTVKIWVRKKLPIITWTPPSSLAVGSVLDANMLNATCDVPGSFAYDPPSGTVFNAGRTLRVTFTPTEQSHETVMVTRHVSLDSGQLITPLLHGSTLLSRRWSEGDVITQSVIEETVPDPTSDNSIISGSFSSPSVGRTLAAGAQSIYVEFQPFDATMYASASITIDLTVFKRADPPAWFGSPAISNHMVPPVAESLSSRIIDADTISRLPAVELSWSPGESGIVHQDILRMVETSYRPIEPSSTMVQFNNAGEGAYPFWHVPNGMSHLVRAPQWVSVARLSDHADQYIDPNVQRSWIDPLHHQITRNYCYRIRSLDAAGHVSYSDAVVVTMPFEHPPMAGPANLEVSKERIDGDEHFHLHWEPPADVSGIQSYEIYLASAVETGVFPPVHVELMRHGLVEHRHRWIHVGSTDATDFTWIDDHHPGLLWSTIDHFVNPEWPARPYHDGSLFVDPWMVEHAMPSLLFRVVAVGSCAHQQHVSQASRMVVIDADRRSLLQPRLASRLNQAEGVGSDQEDWVVANIAADSNASGAVIIKWSPVAYDFETPHHLAFGSYRGMTGFMDWGFHQATIICDGEEVGSKVFNNRFETGTQSFVHRPGPGVHKYYVRISNYYGLTCESDKLTTIVGGPMQSGDEDEYVPYNLSLDRSDIQRWRLEWLPRRLPSADGHYVVYVDGIEQVTTTVNSAELVGIDPNRKHSIQVRLRAENGKDLGQSLLYPVPVDVPVPGALQPVTPSAPSIVAIDEYEVSLGISSKPASGTVSYELERDGHVIARMSQTGIHIEDMSLALASRTFRLRAVMSDDRRSSWSERMLVCVPPDTEPPPAVTELTAVAESDGSISLSWIDDTPIEDVISYRVYRDGVQIANVFESSFVDRSITDTLDHAYTIRSIDRAGNASPDVPAVMQRAVARIPRMPLMPTAYLVQRIREAPYPLTSQQDDLHLSYAVEVNWPPLSGEGSRSHEVAAYRIYRDGLAVADIPVTVLAAGRPLRMTDGALLSRPELLVRDQAYYDSKRERNVWVDLSQRNADALPSYAISAINHTGQESAITASVMPTLPEADIPRRPEILRVRRSTARSWIIEANAWPLLRADPYHNWDYPVAHGPLAPGHRLGRSDSTPPLPYRSTGRDQDPLSRRYLDDHRMGRLLTSDLFGGGDSSWSASTYDHPDVIAAALYRDPLDPFVGSGAQTWAHGRYAEVDIELAIDGHRQQIPRRLAPGRDIDGRPIRILEVAIDDLEPGREYELQLIARTPAGHEAASLPWRLSTRSNQLDELYFVQLPRLIGSAPPHPGSFVLGARALATEAGENEISYTWRHLDGDAQFTPNGSADAHDVIMSFGDRDYEGSQTIRCYATYAGHSKYVDVEINLEQPTIVFDPASFPIFPAGEAVTP
jgi:VCBS repeat-containing protein